MIQEPPPLPFSSLKKLQRIARKTLDDLNTKAKFRFCAAVAPAETENKKPKKKKDACDLCRKKKVKCDVNNEKEDKCAKPNCSCVYHVHTNEKNNKIDKGKGPAEPYDYNRSYSGSSNADFVPSTTGFRKAGLLSSGHYAGETSFCAYFQSGSKPNPIKHEIGYPTLDDKPLREPNIAYGDQLYLIDVYYHNLNPFFPIINKKELLSQLHEWLDHKQTYLSPLFFYALFTRAAHVATDRTFTETNQQTFESLGDDCAAYVSALVGKYQDAPRISTVLALIIMANHLEQTKLPQNLTRSWLWAGEAFRIALDLGIHRASVSEKDSPDGQLCIRTFWLAYITDCTISMTYGRPSATEEKVLDVTAPQTIPNDDYCTTEWLQGLNSFIALSKIAARVIKFNYCPPPPFKVSEPVKRHNAFLASVDSWLTDVMHPHNEPDTPPPTMSDADIPQTIVARRINFQQKMFFYTNLILLHRPYVNDIVASRTCTRPSYDICSYAAIIVTDLACELNKDDLLYHSKSPMVAYALVMAMRVHIMNASHSSSADKFSSDQNYQRGLATLKKLPQYLDQNSLLYDALAELADQYNGRFSLVKEQEVEESSSVALSEWTYSLQDIPSPASIGKRRGSPCITVAESSNPFNIKDFKIYDPPNSVPSRAKKAKGPTKRRPKDNNKEGRGVFRAEPKNSPSSSNSQPQSQYKPAQPLSSNIPMSDVPLPEQTCVIAQQQQQQPLQQQQQLQPQHQHQHQHQQQQQHQHQQQQQHQHQHQHQQYEQQQVQKQLRELYPQYKSELKDASQFPSFLDAIDDINVVSMSDASSMAQPSAITSSSSSPSAVNIQNFNLDSFYNSLNFTSLLDQTPIDDASLLDLIAEWSKPVDNNYNVSQNKHVLIELDGEPTYQEDTSTDDINMLDACSF